MTFQLSVLRRRTTRRAAISVDFEMKVRDENRLSHEVIDVMRGDKWETESEVIARLIEQ